MMAPNARRGLLPLSGSAGTEGGAQMTPAPEAARFAAGGAGDLDSLETRIWAHVKHVCSPSHKGRISTLVKVATTPIPFGKSLTKRSWVSCWTNLRDTP